MLAIWNLGLSLLIKWFTFTHRGRKWNTEIVSSSSMANLFADCDDICYLTIIGISVSAMNIIPSVNLVVVKTGTGESYQRPFTR